MLRAILVLISALGCFGFVRLAQPADKKAEVGKSKDDGPKSKSKEPGKAKPPDKTPSVDELFEADQRVKDLQDQIEALKRQLRPDRKAPTWCRLHGELDGEVVSFSAEYEFSTEFPRTNIVLGLQGGLLTEGVLDGETAIIEFDKDDGFLLRVEKKAEQHKATVKFLVPIKKSSTSVAEREIELGLPGASGTTLNLKLAATVLDLRANGTLEKSDPAGHWPKIALRSSKKLNLAWKEPTSVSGNAPLIKVEGQILARVYEKDVTITADLSFEDSRRQTKEWRLLLPAQAEVQITKAPGGVTGKLIEPDAKTPYHVLMVSDFIADKWTIKVTQHVPRPKPGPRLPIGPFHVLSATVHKGTIAVQMPANVSLGQRLVFTRSENTYQKNADVDSLFTYVAPLVTANNLKATKSQKAPLEIEWRPQKDQLETNVVHELRLHAARPGWELETITNIHVRAFSSLNAIDLKLPQPRPRGVSLIAAVAPGLAFPGGIPWGGVWETQGSAFVHFDADEITVHDELGTPLRSLVQDGTGKISVLVERKEPTKQLTIVLKTKIRIARENQRIRLELPRPLGTQDRGAKLSIEADKEIELLDGTADEEVPVPDRLKLDRSWDLSPGVIELAWRPFQRATIAHSTIDVTVHERTAQIKQTLRFPARDAPTGTGGKQVGLPTPAGVGNIAVLSGGKAIDRDLKRGILWLRPDGDTDKTDIVLQYDLPIAKTGVLDVTAIWPAKIDQKDAKVRVWSGPGIKVRLTEECANSGVWKERSIEAMADKEQFPAFVVHGVGAKLPLSFKIDEVPAPSLAAFVADRALIQVRMLSDGSQHCRARYQIRAMQTSHVDIELPIPLSRFHEKPSFLVGKNTVPGETLDATEKVLRVKMYPEQVTAWPVVLEINYTIPAAALERTSFWRTTLHAPAFKSEVVIRQMNWHLHTATPMIGASFGRNVSAAVKWDWQSWLWTPEPTVAKTDRDAWPDLKGDSADLSYAFALISTGPETVYHLPRTWWLLGCSGTLLIVVLGGYLSPMPLRWFCMVLLGLALSMLAVGILFPALLSPVLFGAQPGGVLCLVFIGGHWLIQERYRRQLVFLPGFTRTKPGSTMVRTKAAKQPREASTVDAPGTEAPDESAPLQPKSSSS